MGGVDERAEGLDASTNYFCAIVQGSPQSEWIYIDLATLAIAPVDEASDSAHVDQSITPPSLVSPVSIYSISGRCVLTTLALSVATYYR